MSDDALVVYHEALVALASVEKRATDRVQRSLGEAAALEARALERIKAEEKAFDRLEEEMESTQRSLMDLGATIGAQLTLVVPPSSSAHPARPLAAIREQILVVRTFVESATPLAASLVRSRARLSTAIVLTPQPPADVDVPVDAATRGTSVRWLLPTALLLLVLVVLVVLALI